MLYIGTTRSESLIPGGHVLAVDAATGAVIWHFNTIPQDENDQGWEIAGPTWVGNVRTGAASGRPRPSIRSSACSTSPSATRSATAPSGTA